MKRHFILFCCFLICYLLLVNSCNLLKKTTKTETTDTQQASKNLQLEKLETQQANRESNLYFYRTDGSIYQHQNIKERIDATAFGTASLQEQTTAKQQTSVKESVPDAKVWMYIIRTLVLVVMCSIALKRFSGP